MSEPTTIAERVRVTNERRSPYFRRTGSVVKRDTRDGRPYLGVEFAGVANVVWFFDTELENV